MATVAELIEKLKQFPEHAEVFVNTGGEFETPNIKHDVTLFDYTNVDYINEDHPFYKRIIVTIEAGT